MRGRLSRSDEGSERSNVAVNDEHADDDDDDEYII